MSPLILPGEAFMGHGLPFNFAAPFKTRVASENKGKPPFNCGRFMMSHDLFSSALGSGRRQ
jgi:hypothetical protein